MEELIKKAEEKGINVEDLILREINKIDPKESIKIRITLAEKFFEEAERFIEKNDPIQSSEKLYKVAEEIVKGLAEKFNTKEYQEAERDGRWYAFLLQKASISLANIIGEWIENGWKTAYLLHVWGFHERRLDINEVKQDIKYIKEMLDKAKQYIN
ncbi:PaREP1 family protein [Sulfolobus tengchongensis]|uniref:PaREP1 family protein n=1 Tax=Sulfolobus tengchongensis TaxID=207809 RepID=A0AAX4KXQ3_9CREN